MRRTPFAALAVVAAAAAMIPGAAPAGASSAAPGAPARSTLHWGACPSPVEAGLQCARLRVPLDYRHPSGRTIRVAVSRLASTDPARKRGVLVVNPGGPGLPGLPAPNLLKLPRTVRDRYDVIGFDPRGVGQSTPVTCGFDAAQGGVAANPRSPADAADVAKQAVTAKRLARQCATSATADLLPYITTANTARDMDRIRAALGVPRISYYGESYGTYLGAVYATLFPHRGDRVVLDSSLPPEGYDVAALRSQAAGFETRFPDFARFAAARPGRYHLGRTPRAVRRTYFRLAARLDHEPVQGYDGTTFRVVTAAGIRADSGFACLAATWHALDANQPLPCVGGAGGGAYTDNYPAAYLAVICGDSRWPRSVATYQRNVALDRVRYPMYGAFAANIRPCAFWHAPVEPTVTITDRGPSTILMVQNLRDPATPLRGALRTRRALGRRARLLTVDQGGHVVYLTGSNRCANNAVTDYLATGRRPSHDAYCPAQPASP
ncbi:alpha/beta hydrolase [Actinocatenispora thailandica]|uniref:Alpha/beta hydrolase n=1 Tax=Actinocatenispora thailandica TaxID=227318 RepID=A0A7R7DLH2_9ACTN|nr:alpha/beta hydrolase [Actinocatenispora thailandica]BCJ33914.1 alpha/beta hydrolase [Actinocatenispora thailandica]